MRTLLFGAMFVTAFLLPVTSAAAQCCGGGAAAIDHSAHGVPATPATPAVPAVPAGCCAKHEMPAPAPAASPMACCNNHAAGVPADDPAVAMAGLGLTGPQFSKVIEVEFPFGGKTAAHGVPIR